MLLLKFHTKLGLFELKASDNETIGEVRTFVTEIMMNRLKYVCGASITGRYIFLSEEVLKDCVIEIIEPKESE